MNILFPAVFIICSLLFLVCSPDKFLATLFLGAERSASLSVALLTGYAVWLGIMRLWEECGVCEKISKRLTPFVKALFGVQKKEALDAVSMNLSVNLLGISGAATPYGIRSAKLLNEGENAEFSSAMLLVLNATSLQLIPTSVIGLRTALGSASPADIVLPTILISAFSTVFAVLLLKACFLPIKRPVFYKKHRAGVR